MTVPEQIDIAGIRYSVELKKKLIDASGAMFGAIEFPKQRIRLKRDVGPDHMRDTLLHEVLHGCIDPTNISTMVGWNSEVEEAVVLALTPHLLAVLRGNPDFVAYLTEE